MFTELTMGGNAFESSSCFHSALGGINQKENFKLSFSLSRQKNIRMKYVEHSTLEMGISIQIHLSFNKLHFLIIDWASECRERPQIEWQKRIITINLIYSFNLCVNIIIKPQNMQIQLITLIHHH